MKKNSSSANWLQVPVLRITRIHFLLAIAYALQTIVFDSWNLISHQAVSQRWTAIGIFVISDTVLWFLAKLNNDNIMYYRIIVLVLIIADILLAGINVYWERGMASTSVILFSLALITAASLRNRSTLVATATLAAVAYSTAAVRYFNTNYGEGFRVQLWGQVGFYSALFFIITLLLMAVVNIPKNSS